MKRHPKTQPVSPANDNVPVRAVTEDTAENMAPPKGVLHVYVQNADNGPVVGVESGSGAPIRKVRSPTTIMTNLPERLPILSEEVALVQGFLADLVSQIIANDNDPL